MDTLTGHATPGTASKGRRLKELINSPEILVAPGVFDGYSARLVEKAGFKSASITGAGRRGRSTDSRTGIGIRAATPDSAASRPRSSFTIGGGAGPTPDWGAWSNVPGHLDVTPWRQFPHPGGSDD